MKPRKNVALWQSYKLWYELMELRKKSKLRISASNRDVTNLDPEIEQGLIDIVGLDRLVKPKNKAEKEASVYQIMVNYGKAVGPIWDWCLSHKGIGEGLAAQLLAQIDDIANFDNPAKLWRHCGYGIYEYCFDEKGKAQAPIKGWKHFNKTKKFIAELEQLGLEEDRHYFIDKFKGETLKVLTVVSPDEPDEIAYWQLPKEGWTLKKHRDINVAGYHSPYNKQLKSTVYLVGQMFIQSQSPEWVDIYYSEKARYQEKYPEKIVENGKTKYNPAHLDMKARRKMVKAFLKELWYQWRISEGLPADEPEFHVWQISPPVEV